MADEATTKKIVQQVEYYFGDSNLRKDKYMKERIAENADGWVGIDILLRFNRLKQLSDDAAVIVAALKTSTSGLIEVNDTDTAVRRTNAQVEDADFDKRTVYVKGFPTDSTLDTLQEFFAPLAKVKAIRMRRRFDTKDFKGSIFVEVDTVEAAEKLATEPLKCGERTLLTMMKEAYVTAKKDEREERKKKKETKAASAVKEPASATSTTTATTSTTESTESTEAKDASDDAGPADDTAAAADDDGEATEPEVAIEPGCVVKFSGVGDQCSREDIKEIFGRFGTIGWIDFNRGETEGHVRFRQVEGSEAEEESVAAKAVRELTSDGKECRVRGEEATLTVVTGDEEREYWRKVAESRKRKADSGPRGGHRGGGRGRGGRGGGRGGRGRGGGGRGRGGGGGGGGRKRKAEDSGEGQTAPKMSKAE